MRGRLSVLWSARSVAVIGASARPGALGRLPMEFLARYGYDGDVLPVHPRATEILGRPAYPSVQAAPGPVELALIMVPADRVPAAVDDCVAAGVPVAIVAASGFAESGVAGATRQRELVEKARAGGLRLVGPNCIGVAGLHTGLIASFSPLFGHERTAFAPGGLGFVSQSGALGFGTVSLAFERGLGLGWAVTTGNEADVTTLEVMCELAAEPACTALLGYTESLVEPDRLRALAATGKPVALLKAGRSAAGARAAASHTGALATEDRVVDAALRQLGIVRVSDVDELLDVGEAFAQPRRPSGPRVAVLTTSGGSGILAADAAVAHGLPLAELAESTMDALRALVPAFGAVTNPVDVTATVMSDRSLMARCLDAVATDPGVDMLVVCFCVLIGADVDAITDALAAVVASGKPVLVARTGADHLAPRAAAALRAAGVPAYPTPARAMRAAAALWHVTSRPVHKVPLSAASLDAPAGTTEPDLKAMLARAGVAVPRGRIARSPDDAVTVVREVGGQAVAKVVVPGLVHKARVGGVELGMTATTAAAAHTRLAALAEHARVYVEEHVSGGIEMLVGMSPSRLGQVLMIGAGGALAEALDDVSVRLLPVSDADLTGMLSEIRIGQLVRDSQPFRDLVTRVAGMVGGWPAGFALDLNPVVVLDDRAVVLDAAYVPREA